MHLIVTFSNFAGRKVTRCRRFLAMFCVTGKMSICYSVPQGEPGTLISSSCVGSDPASTVHPKIIRNFKHTKKIEILATQKYPPFCTLTLRKDPKMHRNEP